MSSTILDRLGELLARTPPFDQLGADLRAETLADFSLRFYEAGEVIVEQHSTQFQGPFVVESGLVRLMDLESQRLIDKCGEGDVFGSFNLLKGGATIYEAKAVEPTVCAVLRAERFQRLYEQDEGFARYFDRDLKHYLARLDMQLDVAGAHVLTTRRLRQLPHRELVTCPPETSARDAARLMRREAVGALVIVQKDRLKGILTDRDLRNKLVAAGRSTETPISKLMTGPVHTIDAEARVLDAMMTMLERRVYRLVITAGEGSEAVPVGLLTDRDLVHFRGQDPVATLRRIEHATTTGDLERIRTETQQHLLHLYRQGLPPETLDAVVATLYDRLVVRVLHLTERNLRQAAGSEAVGLKWAWLRLGGGGRRETGLSSEKYGALLYENPPAGVEEDRARRWFEQLYEDANAALEACGFRTSDDAAPDLPRVLPLRAWKKTYRTWIFETDVEALRPVPPYFDLRAVYGDADLSERLRLDIEDALNVQAMDAERDVLALLTANALEHRPPLSFFRRFVLDRSGEERPAFNIRDRGVRPVVAVARVLALDLRYVASSNTQDRLRHAAAHLEDLADTIGPAIDAYRFLTDFRLAHQLRRVEANEPPDNQIDPTTLTKVQRSLLRNAFGAVSALQEAAARRYHVGRKRFG